MRSPSQRITVALGAVLLVTSSCISFNWVGFHHNAPIDNAVVEQIQPGVASFGDCLDLLGAPQIVWRSENGDVVLAYVWLEGDDWGLSVSYSLQQFVNTSFQWDSVVADYPGVVLIFTPDLELKSVKRGFLHNLVPVPQSVNEFDALRTPISQAGGSGVKPRGSVRHEPT